MSTALPASRPCPACDYDLRASTSGRCPECGTLVGLAPLSRVPWVYRHHRGDRRAYLETLRLLVFHPSRLAQETSHRVQVRHARRFHHESIWLASILATGCLTLAFLMRGTTLEHILSPASAVFGESVAHPAFLPSIPTFALADTMAMLPPLFFSVFISFHVSMWMYRLLFAIGGGPGAASGRLRRRAATLAYYASGLTPLLALSIGGTLAFITSLIDMTYPTTWLWRMLLPTGLILLPAVALYTFYFPTIVLLRRCARAGLWRIFTMAYLFPLLQPPIWIAIAIANFWVAGYLAITFWSSIH